jgi:hypothetical protein
MNNTDNGRPDLQLARDKDLGMMRDNIKNQRLDREILRDTLMNTWANPDDVIPLSKIIKMLCAQGGGIRYITKSDIYPDYSIDEVIDTIVIAADIIPDGWNKPIVSQEQIQIDFHQNGGEIEISVRLIKNEVD